MQINANYQNNILYLCLSGELDEHSAATCRCDADKLADEYVDSESVVFDLRDVSFMDATGIGFLIGRYKKFRQLGAELYITNPSQSTDKILSIGGVYTLMPKI